MGLCAGFQLVNSAAWCCPFDDRGRHWRREQWHARDLVSRAGPLQTDRQQVASLEETAAALDEIVVVGSSTKLTEAARAGKRATALRSSRRKSMSLLSVAAEEIRGLIQRSATKSNFHVHPLPALDRRVGAKVARTHRAHVWRPRQRCDRRC